MKLTIKTAIFAMAMMTSGSMMAQFGGGFGGFGGFQVQQPQIETSQQWKDVNYAGDDQAYHTCDIYLPKKEAEKYPVVIHIYGSAWFSNNMNVDSRTRDCLLLFCFINKIRICIILCYNFNSIIFYSCTHR